MIFLLILKIIGIILLVCLGLLLFLVLLILFDPIFYSVKINSKHRDISVNFKGHWLLYILGFSGKYSNNDLEFSYRILFKTFKQNGDNVENDDSKEISETKLPDSEANVSEIQEQNDSDITSSDCKEHNKGKNVKEKIVKKRNNKLISRIKKIFLNIKNLYNKIKSFIENNENIEALKHIKDELIISLKLLLPKHSKINATFSTGSPDTTAQLLGIIALFPVGYKNKWQIIPDFESDEWYVNGDACFKGRIYLFKFAGIIIRILLDKNCHKLYEHLKN